MCGIAGRFQRAGSFDAEASRGALERCLSAIAHRGPDAFAVRVWPEHGLALGHRRLSILDLSDRANQPLGLPDGSAWVSYNGEIYNFRALRHELEAAGESFRTTSDTEVLLAGYRRWGLETLLSKCAGMFAFALYDAQKETLFLARDRAGKKPLYYAEDSGALVFCSELRGLFTLLPRKPRLDPEGLGAYLSLKFTPAPLTLVEGARKVQPAHYLAVTRSGISERRYWTPLGGKFRGKDPVEAVEAALTTAAQRRLVADVPVSVFLSGGIDSTLVVDRLAASGAKGLATYTIGYGDLPGYSEFEYSRLTAKKYPIDYREVNVSSAEALAALQDPAFDLDDPVADWAWVPLHFLARQARADGFKVVLLGEGSDELFFGYDAMMKGLRTLARYDTASWRAAAKVGHVLAAPVARASRRGHSTFDLVRRAAQGLPLYWGSSIGFPRTQRPKVFGPTLPRDIGDAAQAHIVSLHERFAREAADPADQVNLICFIEFYTKMSEVLLHRVDRVTMLHSLEARAPFLDHELCELAFALPGALKTAGGAKLKALLKDVARRHIPHPIIDRPKMGFSFPFKEWLRGPLGPAVADVFARSRFLKDGWVKASFANALLREHRSGLADHAPRAWLLYSLCRWYDRWLA